MKRTQKCLVGAVFAMGFATSTLAQNTTVGSLLNEGYEIRGVTTAQLGPESENAPEQVFLVLQKDGDAFGCVLRSASQSFCQRIQ